MSIYLWVVRNLIKKILREGDFDWVDEATPLMGLVHMIKRKYPKIKYKILGDVLYITTSLVRDNELVYTENGILIRDNIDGWYVGTFHETYVNDERVSSDAYINNIYDISDIKSISKNLSNSAINYDGSPYNEL